MCDVSDLITVISVLTDACADAFRVLPFTSLTLTFRRGMWKGRDLLILTIMNTFNLCILIDQNFA